MKLNEKNMEKHKNIKIMIYPYKENNQVLINYDDNSTFYSQMLKKKRLIENKENISNNGSCINMKIINESKKDKVSNISKMENNKKINRNISGISNNDVEFEIDYITKNMEKACNISYLSNKNDTKANLKNQASNKSPLRFYFEKDSVMNQHVRKMEREKSKSQSRIRHEKSPVGLSIRKTSDYTENDLLRYKNIGKDINAFNTTVYRNNNKKINEKLRDEVITNAQKLIKGISVKTFTTLISKKNKAPNINSFESVFNN